MRKHLQVVRAADRTEDVKLAGRRDMMSAEAGVVPAVRRMCGPWLPSGAACPSGGPVLPVLQP